jgi:chromosome segregation ATPase
MRSAAALFAASLVPMALLAVPEDRPAGDAYILAVGDEWMSGEMDLDDLVRMRGRLAGDFLWFRRGGKTYRVVDAATLGKADGLFEPVRALEPEFEDLRRKERRLDAREDELDREEELIDQDLEDLDADEEAGIAIDESTRRNLESRREAVRARMKDLAKEQRQLASVERALDTREESLEAQAEAKLWKLIDETIASGEARPAAR